QQHESLEHYWEQQYRRYDNRWQQTYLGWTLTPPVEIAVKDSPMRGSAGAPHTVVIFSDFQCPTCKAFEQWFMGNIVARMAPRYGGLKVVFKYWPISTKCNAFASRDLHP